MTGVISSAGDYKPGIVLDKQDAQPNRRPVALLGKVYCNVDASHVPIELGDLLTTLSHPQGRAFVVPNAAGEAVVNLGDDYADPLRYIKASYREHGQLLIHELTHIWQIHHSGFVPGLICKGIVTQIQNEIEEGVYNPGDGEKDWSEYNLEQQATIVDPWYRGWDTAPCSPPSRLYRHVLGINGGAPPPAVQALSVGTVARRKFGAENGFSVRVRFPRQLARHRWLRRSVIGLRGRVLALPRAFVRCRLRLLACAMSPLLSGAGRVEVS